jgi:GT2 family glycosyltransferase
MVNYKSSEDTICCVDSIKKCKFNYKIIIVDNSVDEYEYKKLKSLECENVKIIQNEENYGFAKANNIGLKYILNNQYVWFLNNDTKINQNLVNKILEHLDHSSNEKTVFFFDILDFNGQKESNGVHYINLLTGSICTRKKIFYKRYICGASLLLCFTNDMPKWNENYFLYYEDVDYAFQLQKNRYKFVYINDCFVNHKIGGSSKNNKIIKIRLLSQYYFIKNHGTCFFLYFIMKNIYFFLSGRIEEFLYLLKIRKNYWDGKIFKICNIYKEFR